MKTILKIMAVAGLAFTMVSCGAANDPYGANYPNNGTIYRAPDGTVYERGDVYRDRNGNVYQNGRVIRTGDIYGQPGILGRSGNSTVYYPNNNPANLPPGQAKKIYGGSAKDYAPGQLKKRNQQYGDYKYKDKKYKKNWKENNNYQRDQD